MRFWPRVHKKSVVMEPLYRLIAFAAVFDENVPAGKAVIGRESCAARTRVRVYIVVHHRWRPVNDVMCNQSIENAHEMQYNV